MRRHGFTLVELAVVVVIIGILAALAIPRFIGASNKAKVAEFKPVLKQIYTLQLAYKQEKDSASSDATGANIGFTTPDTSSARFIYSVDNGSSGFWGKAGVKTAGSIKNYDGSSLGTAEYAQIDSTGIQKATSNLAKLALITSL